MPINSTLSHVKSLIDQAYIPGNSGTRIEAFIAPPDPEVEQRNPHVYVWAARGPENRNSGSRSPAPAGAPQAVALPPAGWKILKHTIECYLTWFNDNMDPQIDSSFPIFIDTVMNILRTCPMPINLIDPSTGGTNCQLINLGENLSYEYVPVRSTASERLQRQDALITAPVEEWIQA